MCLLPALCLGACPLESHGYDTIEISISCGTNGDIYPKDNLNLPVPVHLEVTATPNPGYKVYDWYVDGAATGAGGVNQRQFNWLGAEPQHTIYVSFIRISNLVHISAGPKGTLSPCDTCHPLIGWGESLTFTATPNPHYHVDTWTLDGQAVAFGGNTFVLPDIQAEHWVEVTFAANVYTIQASADPHGTLSPTGAVAVTYGYNRQFIAAPQAGYDRVVWTLDGSPVLTNATSYLLYGIQTNHTLHVSFISPQLSVTLSPTNSVLISWPDAMNSHTLQETAGLSPPSWSNSTARTTLISGRQQATIAPPNGKKFYRISYP